MLKRALKHGLVDMTKWLAGHTCTRSNQQTILAWIWPELTRLLLRGHLQLIVAGRRLPFSFVDVLIGRLLILMQAALIGLSKLRGGGRKEEEGREEEAIAKVGEADDQGSLGRVRRGVEDGYNQDRLPICVRLSKNP